MKKNKVLTEKYRPKSVREVIGAPKQLFSFIEGDKNVIPHILLHSKQPGTGKTSIAHAMIKDLKADYIELNASDERKMEDVREKVKRFVETASISSDIKVVLLDECDGMLKGSQEVLRNLMEKYSAKFIITANNIEKIIEPIQSRCYSINLQSPRKEEINLHLKNIASKEGIKVHEDAFDKFIDIHYPSIRDMITHMQTLWLEVNDEILPTHVKKEEEYFEEIYNLVKEGKLPDARKQWLENGYNLRRMVRKFFELLLQESDLLVIKKGVDVIAEMEYRMAVHADNDITCFWGCKKLRGVFQSQSKD